VIGKYELMLSDMGIAPLRLFEVMLILKLMPGGVV
jgi:hypothetical protein